jgi:endothelin-converting enzyme/putative endopeptidase
MGGVLLRGGLIGALCLTACGPDRNDQTGVDPTALDKSVDPCVDFYQFACGSWTRDNQSALMSASFAERRNQAFFAVEDIVSRIVHQDALGGVPSADDPQKQKIGDAFNACLAGSVTSSVSGSALSAELNAVSYMSSQDLAKEVAHLHELGVSALFSFDTTTDLSTGTTYLGSVDQAGYSLPTSDFYLSDSLAAIRSQYAAHIANLERVLGVPDPNASEAVLRVETALARASLSPDASRDIDALFHPVPRDQFEALVPHFDWPSYFAATGVAPFDRINVSSSTFARGLDALLASTSTVDLESYLRWRLIERSAHDLGDDAVSEEVAFHQGVLLGGSAHLPRDEKCLRDVLSELGMAVAQPYVHIAFADRARTDAEEMITTIRGALQSDMTKLDWLDDATRTEALTKLEQLTDKIGNPNPWPDLTSMTIVKDSEVSNAWFASRFYRHASWSRIGMPIDHSRWDLAPTTVNAYYTPSLNEIVFPAAILQAPFFSPVFNVYSNYGGIGTIMGHELTHGFDDQGRKFDSHGILRDWWTPTAEAAFRSRAMCVADHASSSPPIQGAMIDGQLTLGENIADLGGARLAYAALANKANLRSKGALGVDGAQEFFMMYGQLWCGVYEDQYVQTLSRVDPHAPSKYRVNGVVSNMPEFAAAFHCSEGAPMAPKDRCQVW